MCTHVDSISDSTKEFKVKSNAFWIKKGPQIYDPAIVTIISNSKNQLSASLSKNGICQVWNTKTGVDYYTLQLENNVQITELAFSHDGRQLVTIASSTIYDPGSSRGNYHTDEIKVSLWDAINGTWIKDFSFQQDDPPENIGFSLDDSNLLLINLGKKQVLDIRTGRIIKEGTTDIISQDGVFSPLDTYYLVPYSPRNGDFSLWDLHNDSLLLSRTAYKGFIRTFTWSLNEDILVTTGQEEQTIKTWKIPNGELLRTINLNVAVVHSGSVSPNGKYFAGGSINGEVNVWDLQSGTIIQSYKEYHVYVHCIAWSPTEDLVYSGFSDGTIIAIKTSFSQK
jgi:WD40 repeat protein